MIYEVVIQAPEIDEVVHTEADSEQQAKERAIFAALKRQFEAATVVVEPAGMNGTLL
jgi:hypothetical protein